jgi:hypothetical protein
MDPAKAEFKRLIEMMEWSQTEAARRLYKTPSAINHLVNPYHPNKPSQTTLQLLKLIVVGERPDLINAHTFELREGPAAPLPGAAHLSSKERQMIEGLRQLAPTEREKIYAVISALLRPAGRKAKK